VREFTAVNGVKGNDGTTGSAGVLFVGSGYGSGKPGNVLLAFSVE
jgi:hypothetical protein